MSRGPRRAFRRPGSGLRGAREEIDEELAFHLDACVEELLAQGWSQAEARAEAERRFGDLEATREICSRDHARNRSRRQRGHQMDGLRQDFRFALRTLWRRPTYAAVVVATLAVGIALNTLVFSFMNPYLLRPLPYADADRLVAIGGIDRLEGWDLGRFATPQIADLKATSRSFDAIGHYYYGSTNLATDEGAERIGMARMSGNLFEMLGVDASIGRTLGEADDREGAPPAVVLGHGLWTSRYGASPSIVGTTVRLDQEPHTVVGVMPAAFNFPYNAIDLWLPRRADPGATDRSVQSDLVVGRLAPGVTAAAAREELSRIQSGLATRWPATDGVYEEVSVKPLREALNFAWAIIQPAFLILLAAVALVLLIACVNVASITLARSEARQREMAVRAAVGAGRSRLTRQLLVESLILAAIGGVVGVALSSLGTSLVAGLLPGELFRVGEVTLDARVLLFSSALTLATPLVFGLAPSLAVTRASLASVIRTAGGGVGGGRAGSRARRALVVIQVSLAVVLVASTGLMVRSFANATRADLGFASQDLLVASLTPAPASYPDAAALATYYDEMKARLAAIPGVAGVGMVSTLPLNHETSAVRFTTPAGEDQPVEDRPAAYTSRAGVGYFAAMGIAVVAGRDFTTDDVQRSTPGVVVSRGLAEQLWPTDDAVGRTLVYGDGEQPQRAEVVGVVGDVRYDELRGTPRPHIYRVLDGTATRRRFVVTRVAAGGSVASLVGPVRQAFRTADPDLPLSLRPMTDIVNETTGPWAIGSGFLAVFGLVALALAALGIYGLITFSVQRRRNEMGLRLALGANAGALRRSIVGDGLRLTIVGLTLGLVLAVAVGAALRGVLLGVGALDPISLLGAGGLFLLVAATASWIPARRTSRIDPVTVLRADG